MPFSINQKSTNEMLFPPPPGHHQNFRPQPPIYSSPCYARSAPNILRSRGETAPLSDSHQPYSYQLNGAVRESIGFPGNIPGEYGSDDEHRQDDQDAENNYTQPYRSHGVMQESHGGTHIVTPYAYPQLNSSGPTRLDIPYYPPNSTQHPGRSRNTSHSTYLSTPTTATTNISATTPTSISTPMRSRTTTQTSTMFSPASSSRMQPLPFGTPSMRGQDGAQAGRQSDHHLMPGSRSSRNRSRGRPGTGSTVESIPYSVGSSFSTHNLGGSQGLGSYSQSSIMVTTRTGQGPYYDRVAPSASPASVTKGDDQRQRFHAASIPLTKSKIPHRLQALYTFLTASSLTVETGIEGVQEWVGYWVDRGVRVRDLSSDLSGLIKGPLALHTNLPIVQSILQDPKIHLVLPPQLHKCAPLLPSQAFWEISKKIVVDALVSADRLYSGLQSNAGENIHALEPRPDPPRKRFRSNSGSDLQARERKMEEDRKARECVADEARKEGGGRTTPSLSLSTSGGSNGLSRFLSRSGKKEKVSIDHSRPISFSQSTGPGESRLIRTLSSAPDDPPRPLKRLGLFKRRQRSTVSGKQDATTLDEPVGVGGMSARGLTAIFLGSVKVKSKKDPAQTSVSNIERMQIRSLDRTGRDRDTAVNDLDLDIDLAGGDWDVPKRQAEAITTLGSSAPQPSSKLREQQVQEVLLAYIAKRMTAWDLKKEIHNHSSEDNDSFTASGSDSRSGLSRSTSRMAMSRQASRTSEATNTANGNSKQGMMELEALNAKLAQIEFEMILNCGRHFHPAIQSALHKVRFHMGYCSSIQLVKRLNALDREFHRNAKGQEIQVELSEPEKRRVMTKIEAWLRVRWDVVDRWELAKIVKDEILGKIPEDLIPIVHGAVRTVPLPITPFPPFRSSASNFRVGRMPANRASNQRRPSLPNTLATWGGSTPNLISGSLVPGAAFAEARIQTILSDILALPTAANTKELLIEWLRRARQYRLAKSLGWWIAVSGEESGINYADDMLHNLEKGCLDHCQPHLNQVFVEIRKAFQLPQQSADIAERVDKIRQEMVAHEASHYRSSVTPIQDERPKITHINSYESAFEVKRTVAPSSGTALQLVTEVSPPMSARRDSVLEHMRPASDETASGDLGQIDPGAEPHTTKEATTSDNGYDASQIVASQNSVRGSDKADTGSPRLSSEIAREVAARHRKGLSKMSVFSSETALEMASIFATRGSESRASVRRNSSPEPEPESELPHPKLSPLTEEPRSISEFGGPEELEPTLPVNSPKMKSIPLEQELELAVDGEDEIEAGEISPFPKPTSPPHSIPSRSTSLHHGRTGTQTVLLTGPVNGSILKQTVHVRAEPDHPVPLLPSTLSQVMRLFEPGCTQLATNLTPGMLEIELLKIIESERQKAVDAGRDWTRENVVRVRWLLDEIQMTANVPHIHHIFARVRSSLESHSVASSAGSAPIPSTGILAAASSVDENSVTEARGLHNPPSIGTNIPLSSTWCEFSDEKAALAAGQLRLVNPSIETSRPPEERQDGDFSRPRLRSAVSSHEGTPGSGVAGAGESDAPAISIRQSRRVSFAGYGTVGQARRTRSQDTFVDPAHELLEVPPSDAASALVPRIWAHEIKDAPPPYQHAHKRARSETP